MFKPRTLSPEMAKVLERSRKALEISQDVQAFLTTDAFKGAVQDVMEQKNPATTDAALLEGAATALDAAADGEEIV